MSSRKINAQPNQSLIDGITTLQALATADKPVGGRELARQLGFEPTRLNRLLKTLAYLGIARQTKDRKYTSGPGMHVLAAQSLYASGLIRQAMPQLEGLRRFNLVVAMGVLWRDSVSYLYHAPPGVSSSEGLGRIGLFPATSGGIGLSLLSALDDEDIIEIYEDAEEIPGFSGGVSSLIETVHGYREQGYVRVLVRPEVEQYTVAINVGKPAHSSIALSGWIPEDSAPLLVEALREAKHAIEKGGSNLSEETNSSVGLGVI